MLKEMYNELVGKSQSDLEYLKLLIETSGKMILFDKLMTKFLSEKKKILIFSQFTSMISLLEDYFKIKQIKFEKITGDVKSMDR